MTGADVLLLALGAVAVGAGALVVGTRHLVRAGLWLVVCLGALAGDYLVLTAELVAWVQVLIYVGAVVVLLLFAVMLTRAPIGASDDLDRPGWPAALVGGGSGLGLAVLLVDAFRWSRVGLPTAGTAERLGEQVFRSWVLPFELLSVLLLAALVGAVVLSRPDIGRPGTGGGARTDRPGGSGIGGPGTGHPTGPGTPTGRGRPAGDATGRSAPARSEAVAVADEGGRA